MNTKQTEIGEIPEDWEVVKLGEVAPLQRGFDLPERQRVDGAYPVVYSNGILNTHNAYKVKAPGVVTGRSGTLGRVHYLEEDFWAHNTTLWVTDFINVEPKFIAYLFQFIGLERFGGGSGVPTLNRNDVHDFQVALPQSKPEQTAIAAVLSDTDRLLAALRALIGKKRAVKTAVMQQLLSGRLRLSGFASNDRMKNSELGEIPEDWEVVSYGDIFQFLSTSTNPRSDLIANGELLYLHYGDIHTKLSTHLNIAEISLPRISAKLVSSAIVKDGDVIMADASEDYDGIGKSVEVCNIGAEKMVSGLHTFLLRDTDKRLADGYRGFLHCIPSVKRQFNALATGLKVYGVSKGNLKTVLLPLPPKPEQTAIAQTLSDMDSEITALEARAAKLAQIKQGLMQNLLTGKIRVNTEAA